MCKIFSGSLLSILVIVIGYYFVYDSFDPESVRRRKVLITGASQNIGRHLALEYAKLGANVVVTARREEKLKEVIKECEFAGAGSAAYIVADMSDLNQTKSVIDKAVDLMGGLDILVLNHIISVSTFSFWNGSQSQFDYLQKSAVVNYLSYVHLSTHAVPHLSKSRGQMVVVSSLTAQVVVPYVPSYAATKAAVTQFYSDLRLEASLQKKSFSITICMLGYIATKPKKGVTDNLNLERYPVELTAREVIQGAANRKSVIYVPKYGIFTVLLPLFPTSISDYIAFQVAYR